MTARTRIAASFDVVRKDDAKQIVTGVVLEPCTAADPDSQGDWYTAETIAGAAHRFMTKLAKGEAGADLLHGGESIGVIVESFLAPCDLTLGDQLVKAGSWVASIHYPDADVWSDVSKGNLAAFSIGGHGNRAFGGF